MIVKKKASSRSWGRGGREEGRGKGRREEVGVVILRYCYFVSH